MEVKSEIINSYLQRNKDMNLNSDELFAHALQKLTYVENKKNALQKKKIIHMLSKKLESLESLDNLSEKLNELYEDLLSSTEYHIFSNNLDNRINRRRELEKYKDDNLINFYNELSIEELYTLGY